MPDKDQRGQPANDNEKSLEQKMDAHLNKQIFERKLSEGKANDNLSPEEQRIDRLVEKAYEMELADEVEVLDLPNGALDIDAPDVKEDFNRSAKGHVPHYDAGELSREFNHAAKDQEVRQGNPEPTLNMDPPGLGGAQPAMNLEEEQASRIEELQASLSQKFNRASKERANKPDPGLGR